MNVLARVGALTAIWCLLWGDLSVANVLSGAVLSAILLLAFPVRAGKAARRPLRFRPLGCARFALHVLSQFVVSNALVAREIVARRSRVRTGIVACPLRTESEPIITLLANVLALSPGTMPVDVQTSPPVIHLHVLVLRDVAQARKDVARLEQLAVAAFGSDDDIARLSTPAGEKVVVITTTFVLLGIATALFMFRMLAGPTLADRVNALNGVLIAGMSAIAVGAVDTGRGAFLPVVVVATLVSFVGTAMVARFIEGRGR